MKPIGFSTGALAKGDFIAGLDMQRGVHGVRAVELSALRDHELSTLLDAVPSLDLDTFDYVSFHAPSRLHTLDERDAFALLQRLPATWPIIAHPELLQTPKLWRGLGERLCIENMDDRKSTGRTPDELLALFERFPAATFCFDVGHARQVDASMESAVRMLRELRGRLRELHVSEVGAKGEHLPLSHATREAFAQLTHLIPADCPVIIESVIAPGDLANELAAVRAVFDAQPV
ncbi:MAG TPA: hypothetical protein VF787_09280 [Thermoanaerobaculia bacterium]